MNRRTFLCSTAAAAAPSGPRIRIAFLGGTHPHAPAKLKLVRESPLFDFAGLCEDDPAARARYARSGVPMIPRRQALGDPSIRVIAVESDVRDHFADARAALQAGRHVHIEKPPATDLKGLRELLALAQSKRLLLQPGYMWRQHPGINRALEAARNGWLGEVFMVRGTINTLLNETQRGEIAGFSGGQMFELGGHLIDPMIRLLGRPRKVTPVLQKLGTDALADNTAALFEFPRAIGIIATSSRHPAANRHRSFEIYGTNGCAEVRPIEPPSLLVDLARAAGPYRVNAQTVELLPYTRYVDDFAELAAAVNQGRPLAVTAGQELNVQEALLAASGM